ncbi:MAG: hypothetical protein Q7U04_14460 [Bacteriovorax sp.]|nr:hypothetical protein [Bacteriovorax sp.]
MKKMFTLLTLIFSTNLYCAQINCNILLNQDSISQVKVSTIINQKISISSAEGVFAFVTETEKDHYLIEAYLSDYDLRLYVEGTLRDNNDKLSASAWGRESMVEIACNL